ncbi:hypothetical protein GDO81_000065 [Engystomops pustulosus]|uniref:Uncharacterized protein n=1 Tax=Engystomops pustulosus TaxID=76066 RepID=A0AAV7D157_ENGPU|nr:hypothetical protein GDO81_000065 [Engystomops pustulosus]
MQRAACREQGKEAKTQVHIHVQTCLIEDIYSEMAYPFKSLQYGYILDLYYSWLKIHSAHNCPVTTKVLKSDLHTTLITIKFDSLACHFMQRQLENCVQILKENSKNNGQTFFN